jgi:hypothetical protein
MGMEEICIKVTLVQHRIISYLRGDCLLDLERYTSAAITVIVRGRSVFFSWLIQHYVNGAATGISSSLPIANDKVPPHSHLPLLTILLTTELAGFLRTLGIATSGLLGSFLP